MGRDVKYTGKKQDMLNKALRDAKEYVGEAQFNKIAEAIRKAVKEDMADGATLHECAEAIMLYFPPYIDFSGSPLRALIAYALNIGEDKPWMKLD